MTVIPFRPPEPPEPRMWQCACGSWSFHLRDDASVECCGCAKVSPDNGGWIERLPAEDRPPGVEPVTVTRPGTADLARERLRRLVGRDDAVLIVVALADARTTAWTAAETAQQLEWALEKIEVARQLVADMRPSVEAEGTAP